MPGRPSASNYQCSTLTPDLLLIKQLSRKRDKNCLTEWQLACAKRCSSNKCNATHVTCHAHSTLEINQAFDRECSLFDSGESTVGWGRREKGRERERRKAAGKLAIAMLCVHDARGAKKAQQRKLSTRGRPDVLRGFVIRVGYMYIFNHLGVFDPSAQASHPLLYCAPLAWSVSYTARRTLAGVSYVWRSGA